MQERGEIEEMPDWLRGAFAAVIETCNTAAVPLAPAAGRYALAMLAGLELDRPIQARAEAVATGGTTPALAVRFSAGNRALDFQFYARGWRAIRYFESGKAEVKTALAYGPGFQEAARHEARWLYPETYPPIDPLPLLETGANRARVARTSAVTGATNQELLTRAHSADLDPGGRVEALDELRRRRDQWDAATRDSFHMADYEVREAIRAACRRAGRPYVLSRGVPLSVDAAGELIRIYPK